MRRLASLVAAAIIAAPLAAQNVQQQAQSVVVGGATDQQRWQAAAGNLEAFMVAGIAQAKAAGRTPEDFGRLAGQLFAPEWGPANSGTPLDVARGTLRNMLGFPGTDGQIEAATDTSATIRYRRAYAAFFGPTHAALGVTLDEYDRALDATFGAIANYLGVRYASHVDGDFTEATFAGRGSAAPAEAFPLGTYAVTFSPQALQDAPELDGDWEVTFDSTGHAIGRNAGSVVADVNFTVHLDQLTVTGEDCGTPAVYRWHVDPTTKALSFTALTDDCSPERATFLTRGVFGKR